MDFVLGFSGGLRLGVFRVLDFRASGIVCLFQGLFMVVGLWGSGIRVVGLQGFGFSVLQGLIRISIGIWGFWDCHLSQGSVS